MFSLSERKCESFGTHLSVCVLVSPFLSVTVRVNSPPTKKPVSDNTGKKTMGSSWQQLGNGVKLAAACGQKKGWRRSTLPQSTCSTIDATELNGRVRNGIGCDLCAIATSQKTICDRFLYQKRMTGKERRAVTKAIGLRH